MVDEWLNGSIHPYILLYFNNLPSKGVWVYGYFTFSREKIWWAAIFITDTIDFTEAHQYWNEISVGRNQSAKSSKKIRDAVS